MEAATIGYFGDACARVLKTSPVAVNENNFARVINIEWLCQAAQKVYLAIHRPNSNCTRYLSASFSKNSKVVADIKLVDSVVSYLSKFNTPCTALTPCSTGVCACKSDCSDCDCNCVMCVDCRCCNACACNCACDCGSDCECSSADCGEWACNCSLNKCAASVCSKNCDCNCTCANCGVFCCDDCCFITTAVCETLGKPDDCYELTVFRNFRDEWLKNQPDGEMLIDGYYQIAPAIVKNINSLLNRNEIYLMVLDKWLEPCLRLIEEEKFQECKLMYIDMVKTLEKKYYV